MAERNEETERVLTKAGEPQSENEKGRERIRE